MAMEVMTRMIQRTGRCPLPLHDSFLVADIDAEPLKETMTQVAGEHGLALNLKESRAISTTIQDLDQELTSPGPQHRPSTTPSCLRPSVHHRSPEQYPEAPPPEVYSTRYTPPSDFLDPYLPTPEIRPSPTTLTPTSPTPNSPTPIPITHIPTAPYIHLEVTTPDLQGQEGPNGSNEPHDESRKREIDTSTTTISPTSHLRAPNWHDPPRESDMQYRSSAVSR